MDTYADTSFLVAIYSPEGDSIRALRLMQSLREALPFTPFHRHELRTAIRLRVFRGSLTIEQRDQALREIESDIEEEILSHVAIPWTDAFREAEVLSVDYTETLGVRSFDLLHVSLALCLGAKEFLTFDARQAQLAKAAGLRVKP